jgi:hypothetical protein
MEEFFFKDAIGNVNIDCIIYQYYNTRTQSNIHKKQTSSVKSNINESNTNDQVNELRNIDINNNFDFKQNNFKFIAPPPENLIIDESTINDNDKLESKLSE